MRKIIFVLLIIMFSASVSAISQIDCAIHDCNGLVSYWKFDEAAWSGVLDEAVDSVGANDGTSVLGADTVTNGKVGRAGHFDGIDDYLRVPNSASLDITEAITITLWARLDNDRGSLIQKDGLSFTGTNDIQGPWAMTLRYQSLLMYYDLGDGTSAGRAGKTLDFSSYIDDGQYHFYALTYDRSTLNIWLDSTTAFNIWDHALGTHTSWLEFGRSRPWSLAENWHYEYFEGDVDEVTIWNRALSASEIDSMQTLGYLPLGGEPLPGEIPEFSTVGILSVMLILGGVFLFWRKKNLN